MTEETTTEQLAEIEGQADTPATEYTPPEGWRVLAVGEVLQLGDQVVQLHDGKRFPTERVGQYVCETQRYIRPIEPQPEPQAADTPATEYKPPEGWRVVRFGEPLKGGDEYHAGLDRYIRRTAPQPEPQPQPQAEAVQVREGRWRTRGGEIKNIRPCEPLQGAHFVWPWTDGFKTFQDNGRHLAAVSDNDLVEYLGPIEPDKTQELPTKTQEPHAAAIEELRSEVSYVQNLLGTERRRVAELEELVGSLRTINVAQEKAFEAAGQDNTALKNQLAAVKAELASVAADRQRLQIELDAAQQVPAAIADRFEEGWNQGTARAVETVLAWLEPIRLVDSAYLANATMQHLPQIMRHLTGLDSHAID